MKLCRVSVLPVDQWVQGYWLVHQGLKICKACDVQEALTVTNAY